MRRYGLIIFWSDKDNAFIAEFPEALPGFVWAAKFTANHKVRP